MEAVNVAICSNQDYFRGLQAVAASIAVYANCDTYVHFHILDDGLLNEEFEQFKVILSRLHERIKFSRYLIDSSIFKGLPAWGGNYMSYMRLMLPEVMKDYEYVIYTDVDVLWLAPIEDLWRMRNPSVIVHACLDGYKETERAEENWYKRKGLPSTKGGYFCDGVMLINLGLFRKENIVEKTFEFIKKYPDVHFPEQTALNQVLLNRVEIIPESWNFLTVQFKEEKLNLPVVLHYAGEIPWKRKTRGEFLSDTVMIWHWFNDVFIFRKCCMSVKLCYSYIEILYKRALFFCVSSSFILSSLLYLFLKVINKRDLAISLKKYSHKISRDSMRNLLAAWKQK